jgi:phosphopantothenoylcysteine decarboxylase/phosphopantothenate--cysteine ligase
MMRTLSGKNVLLCVGGGIAAYKAPELVRRLLEAGASVQVAMTKAASAFITPLTLQAVSRKAVATDLLDPGEDATIGHIDLARRADLVLVAPATADLIARMAQGRADDIVTAALLAVRAPVVVAPAMNSDMLAHPAVLANIETLRCYGHRIVSPDHGELACGTEGQGRMPDAEVLVAEAAAALSAQDLRGVRILVSAGPTREPVDPVRVLTNRSSGRMGYAVVEAAVRRGADVVLVSGPTALPAPRGCLIVPVETAAEMHTAVRNNLAPADVVVMVAAVADYRPAAPAASKIKKRDDDLVLRLEKTEDILAGLRAARGQRLLVGFAAETDNVIENAVAKLESKQLDMIVANDVSAEGSGFDVATNAATLIDRNGGRVETGLLSKQDLADRILDRVVELRQVEAAAASGS